MRYIILGTAGHIDHGKSTLVHALTGIDPDRLKEEKERGITIDLGFAFLRYDSTGQGHPEGLGVGIVDVPGHEKLIKNMLAGAGGIDMVLLVIAADEGIMPQSREHLAICNLLRIKKGLVALTKSDLVESDWLNLVTEDVRGFVKGTFLEGSGIIPVSARTGKGLDLLKERIRDIASSIEPKPHRGIFRLPVDRVFTLKGFGTVVTGTALSGDISVDAPLEVLPGKIKTRVRALQSHGEALVTARAGQRVSINLQGVEKQDIRRGNVVTVPDRIYQTFAIDAAIELLGDPSIPALKNRSLVHFHTGTLEITGRVILYDSEELKPGNTAYGQFRFPEPIAVMAGDRYIIRRFSPLLTVGGGEILDATPRGRKKREGTGDLRIFELGSLEEKISMKILHGGMSGVQTATIEGWISAELPDIERAILSLVKRGEAIQLDNTLLHMKAFDAFSRAIVSATGVYHEKNPLRPGIPKEDLRALFRGLDQKIFDGLLAMVKNVVLEKGLVRIKTFRISLSEDSEHIKERVRKILEGAVFQPPGKDDLAKAVSVHGKKMEELLKIMVSEGALVRINDSIYLLAPHYTKMLGDLKTFFKGKTDMTVGEFRDLLGTTRKYALPFLEYLDSNKITLRVGEVRKLLAK